MTSFDMYMYVGTGTYSKSCQKRATYKMYILSQTNKNQRKVRLWTWDKQHALLWAAGKLHSLNIAIGLSLPNTDTAHYLYRKRDAKILTCISIPQQKFRPILKNTETHNDGFNAQEAHSLASRAHTAHAIQCIVMDINIKCQPFSVWKSSIISLLSMMAILCTQTLPGIVNVVCLVHSLV